MFRSAYSIARGFVLPVVLLRRIGDGTCSAAIGSCVVINSDGWIVTALHIMEQFNQMATEAVSYSAFEAEEQRLRADTTLDKRERQKKIASLKWPAKTQTRNCSAWLGHDGVEIKSWTGIKGVDLAVAKIEPFDPAWVTTYPTFKDPTKNFEPGVSLCKLGFPFHQITPTWNEAQKVFEIGAKYLPLPIFPIEGIFTRTVNVELSGASAPSPYPLQFIETSSPGLKGQSGGPTFDKEGTVWGIQSQTVSLALGFEGPAKGQCLNVGLGVHPSTFLPFFDDNGIVYNKSTY